MRAARELALVELTPEVEATILASRAVVDRAVSGERLIYGLNTGLGHMRDHRVPLDVLQRYQRQMIEAHASGIGPPLDTEDVRAAMLARVSGAARGGSGLTLETVRLLVAMLNAGVHPVVPSTGSVGAGDLMHMAAIAVVLIGTGEAELNGELLPAAEALARAGLTPIVAQPKEGLALVSLQRRRDRRGRARGRGGSAAGAPGRSRLRALARGRQRQPRPLRRGGCRGQGDPRASGGGRRGARAARGLVPARSRRRCSRCRTRSRSGSRRR